MSKNLTLARLEKLSSILALQSTDSLPRTAPHGTKKSAAYVIIEQLQNDNFSLWDGVKDSTVMQWISDIEKAAEKTYTDSKTPNYPGLDLRSLSVKGEITRTELASLESSFCKIGRLIDKKGEESARKEKEQREMAKKKASQKEKVIKAAEKAGRQQRKVVFVLIINNSISIMLL